MNIYLAVTLWWIIIPATAITAGCGIWKICTHCWREYQAAKQWDDKIGAGSETPSTPWAGRNAPHGTPGPDSPWDTAA